MLTVMTTALKSEIRHLARESVREALESEMTKIRVSLTSLISHKEQLDIEKLYKKPSNRAVRTLRAYIA